MSSNVIISSILWIILILIILIFLILILPIKVTAIREYGKWKIDLKILFLSIDLSQISQVGNDKLKKNGSYGNNFEVDFEGTDSIYDFFCLLGMIMKTAKKIFILAIKKLTVKDLTFKIAVGSENSAETAINYGRISSVVYPVAAWLIDLNKPKSYSISVSPDFLSAKTNFCFKLCAKTRIWNLLILVIEILKNLKIK